MLKFLPLLLALLALTGCGPTCEQACAQAVECGAFDSTESDDCINTCSSAEDDVWLTCMDTEDCTAVEQCSL